MKTLRFPRLAYNVTTFTGTIVAIVAGMMMAFFLLFRAWSHEANPYVGILVYMVLPPVLFGGLLLIPIGMWHRKRAFDKRGEVVPQWPHVDLSKPTHRNAFFVFVAGTMVFVLISVVGGYQAFHFTESVEFCGTTCHVVMKPEHTAYQNSPHARVACTECHVGSGADWYAKSKLSGAYQVYATARNIFPRPIPTPIHNLRPAAETCEQCHWPEKFFGSQQKLLDHYMYDEDNTHWPINLVLKTGGGDPESGHATGIHWHMNISATVEYIARDDERQEIPWIRITHRGTGETTIYQDEEDPLSAVEIAAATPRVMDCVDCHNRPSHNYHSPDFVVDRAISSGRIDRTLPEVKRVAVEAIDGDYATEAEGLEKIAHEVRSFYEEEYPEVWEDRRGAVEAAVTAAQRQFATNMFPEMGVKWRHYPDNIGHFVFKGCMRCHGGNHRSDDGKTISRDCQSCHVILAQGGADEWEMASTPEGLEFRHPDGDDDWRDTGCYECHEGVEP